MHSCKHRLIKYRRTTQRPLFQLFSYLVTAAQLDNPVGKDSSPLTQNDSANNSCSGADGREVGKIIIIKTSLKQYSKFINQISRLTAATQKLNDIWLHISCTTYASLSVNYP